MPQIFKYSVTYLKFWDIVLKTNICVPYRYSLTTREFKTVITFKHSVLKYLIFSEDYLETVFYFLHFLFRFTVLEIQETQMGKQTFSRPITRIHNYHSGDPRKQECLRGRNKGLIFRTRPRYHQILITVNGDICSVIRENIPA